MARDHLIVGLLIGTACIAATVTATASGSRNSEASLQHLNTAARDAAPPPPDDAISISAQVLPSHSGSTDDHQVALAHATVVPDPPRASRLEGPMPVMKFRCEGAVGYFVEPSFACKAFHYCDSKQTRYTFLCDEGTTFNQILGECQPGQEPGCDSSQLLAESDLELTSEALSKELRPELTSQSRRRGQPMRPHDPPHIAEGENPLSPSNPDGDILLGSQSVKTAQLRQPGERHSRGRTTAAGFLDEIATPEPRIVTISERVPVAESIRSTTGRPIQSESSRQLPSDQFLDGTGNSAPSFNRAANSAPLRANPTNDALFFDGQFQQSGSSSEGGFVGQDTGFSFGGPSSGFDGRSSRINGQVPGFNRQGFQFNGQSSRFDPGFSGLDPGFGETAVGFDGRNTGFTGRSSGFGQSDPRFGGPAFVGQDPGFVAQESAFNGPPADFSSGVPFAFREFGEVPSNQGLSPVTTTGTGAGVGSHRGTGQVDTGVNEEPTTADAREHQPAFEASQKVGRLSGSGSQLAEERGNNPFRFAPVVAEGGGLQPGTGLGSQRNLQQNGFQPINGGFLPSGRAVRQGVNDFQSVSQRPNPFVPPGNLPRFPPSDGRFIQGNLEILFPQQFRQDEFRPRQSVFQPDLDGLITDQDRFSSGQRVFSRPQQRFVPGQARIPQEQNRFLPSQNNFEPIQDRFLGRQNELPQQQQVFPPDRGEFSPDRNFPTQQDRFPLEKNNHPSTFDEPLKTRGGLSQEILDESRTNDKHGTFSADQETTQQAGQTNLDKLTENEGKGREIRINRGKFPLPRDQFIEAKKESRFAEDNPIQNEASENENILKNALRDGENNIGPIQDEINTVQSRLRPSEARFLPIQDRSGPGTNDFNRAIFALNPDELQTRPGEQDFGSNENRHPPEHRSFASRFPSIFSRNQDRFSINQGRFSQDQRRFSPDQDNFFSNEDKFQLDENRFSPDQNQFSQNQNQFSPSQNQFSPNSNQFSTNQNQFSTNRNQLSSNQNQFPTNLNQLNSDQGKFSPGQDRFAQFPGDQNGIPTGQNRFTPEQSRFTPNQNRFSSNKNGVQQDQGRFIGQDSFGQSTPQFHTQPSLQPNQGRFRQNLNPAGNILQQSQGGFPNNPNQFQQENAGFGQGGDNQIRGFDGFGDFGGTRVPQDTRFPTQNVFPRNPSQFQSQPGSGPSQFPSQFSSTPGRDTFAPPQQGNIHGNQIIDEQDGHEFTTAPPPRLIAPLPKAMIDHMDKSDAEASEDQSAPSASSGGSAPSAPGRVPPGRRRSKPPRHRPQPQGHVRGATGPSGAAQDRFGLSAVQTTTVRPRVRLTRPSSSSAPATDIPLRRVLPGGRTSSIIRTRPSGFQRRRPGARRILGRRRHTTPEPEVNTEVSDVTGSSDSTGLSDVTGPSGTSETTAPSSVGGSRLARRRKLRTGFRQRARTRLRRPGRTDTTAETTGTGLSGDQPDAVADSTLERPQFVDAQATSPSGDGLLREPSTFDATTVKPGAVRGRRLGARRRRLRGRQRIARPASTSPSASSPSASTSASSEGRTDSRQYRDGDRVNGQRSSTDAAHNNGQDENTWLDGATAPSSLDQQRSQPGSRRPPLRRFRPSQRRVNDFQRADEKPTSASAGGQDFQNTGRGSSAGFNRFQDVTQNRFDPSGSGTSSQNFADGDVSQRGFGQNRFTSPSLVQNDFLDSAASGPSHSLTHPSQRRQQFQHQNQQDTHLPGPVRGRRVFHRPSDLPTAPSVFGNFADPVTAPSRTDRFRHSSRHRTSLPLTQPTVSSIPREEDVVTGRSIGGGPVTIVSTGNSIPVSSPSYEDATTAATEPAGLSWSEPNVKSETTTRRPRRPSLPDVADLPPDLVDRRHPHSRSSTSLSDMLNGRRHSGSSKQTDKHHRTDNRHRIHHLLTTEATLPTPTPMPTPTAATPQTAPTQAATNPGAHGDRVSAGGGDWRTRPWTTSFEKVAARGSVSTAHEADVSLDSITEMVAATTTERPTPAVRGGEEPRLPLQALFDSL